MRLLFTVDIDVEVPDAAVAAALEIANENEAIKDAIADGRLAELAIGSFGDLQLVKGNEPEGHLGTVEGYTTSEQVELVARPRQR